MLECGAKVESWYVMRSPRRTDSRSIVYKHATADRRNGMFCDYETEVFGAYGRRWLRQISICDNMSSQRVRGKSGAAVQRVAMK